jgi:Lhr-like helicase
VDVFDLDRTLVADYASFARSFTQIRAQDIRDRVDAIYASRRFWPEPLITVNPHFERGSSVEALVRNGSLHPDVARVFRVDGQSITLYRHQMQAIAKALGRQSFAVTTGTGSGKSLCFFIPIIDVAIRARAAGEEQRTRAIVIYPMNALANSQREELNKFLEQSGLPENLRPTFARYTGQETHDERMVISKTKPDILLTNFMMLELLMTRQDELDQTVIENAQGLEFIILDELHTYRGRQGADVAMLVRRLRDRLCRDRPPLCIGTSATMSSQENEAERAVAVAKVASRLFGADIPTDAVIDETFERATDSKLKPQTLGAALANAIDADLPATLADKELRSHPLAVWIELEIGLQDGQQLRRRLPTKLSEAAERLAAQTGRAEARCRAQLQSMLIMMSRPASERGGTGERAFLAFKLHRFISGAGHVYATLRSPGQRRVTLDGQRFDPQDPDARLYATFFCRNCGQEHHPVVLLEEGGLTRVLPRPIDETPIADAEEGERAGYLTPDRGGDDDFAFTGAIGDYPEDWIETGPGGLARLRSNRRRSALREITVSSGGTVGTTGIRTWFQPGKFQFCPACKDQPPSQAREINKLASLSAEGRSSATTLLVSTALRWMNGVASSVPSDKRKLLGFTDNRQDAALQAGHFNDFLFVSLLRAATLAAIRKEGAEGLAEEDFGRRVQQALGFTAANQVRRQEWMLDPEAKGPGLNDAERTLSRVIAHRVWADQRRGWRFTNPSLEELGLVRADYIGLEELADDDAAFETGPAVLRAATPDQRKQALRTLLDTLRRGLAVTADVLDPGEVDAVANASRQRLREPWSISAQERQRHAAALILDAPKREEAGVRGEPLIVRGGPRSRLARELGHPRIWGKRLDSKTYSEVVAALLKAAASYQIVRPVSTSFDVEGWRLAANALRLFEGEGRPDERPPNPYFVSLYRTLADALASGAGFLFGQEGREHTAQVDQERRQWREWRFRWGAEDRERLAGAKDAMRQVGEPGVPLPALFCSPTMELGVDISALNAVYLRNMPPTPANYAQRSGRAGRSGQAALVVAYCAAQGPHDQYYFAQPREMVSGIVRPPAIELANRDLVRAHLHAIWLAESGKELAPDIPHVVDLSNETLSIQEEIAEAFAAPDLKTRAGAAMKRVLDGIAAELTPEAAPWAIDREAFAAATADAAEREFSNAFDRWRQLYQGARDQLKEANRKSELPGLSAKERRAAKEQQAQANEQLALLERGTSTYGSDFYTYRYLATEGFLPGYNFPRLPLYAYVPSIGGGPGGRAAYLQRARFVAIAEFGPGSLIYHEGRAFRVYRAKLPASVRTEDGGKLATATLFICGACGAAHQQDEPERCHACGAAMAGINPIRNVLRIDNVETAPAERITANDEERQHQGFDIQTVFAWPRREGVFDVTLAVASDADGPILSIDYASGATISRLNKGLRRRKEKSIFGFGIDPATGRWTGSPEEGDDEATPEDPVKPRVVPIVQDTKNAALLRLSSGPLSKVAMATLQHALARGIGLVFQLEEGETLTEPVPSRDARRAILTYEATEGGAGVLGRVTTEPRTLARVARTALELMHYRNFDAAVPAADPALLEEDPEAQCVKGCYRCLLSYYNQPDHELIDRTDDDVRRVLLRLARGEVAPIRPSTGAGEASAWAEALSRWGLPLPDAEPLSVDGAVLPLAWRAHLAAAAFEPVGDDTRGALGALGFAVITVPDKPGDTPPPQLAEMLGGAA